MARTLLVGAEIACPTTAGAATSFTEATVLRLVNTDTTAHKVTLLESVGGAGIGSMTLPAGNVEYLEKRPSQVLFAANASVLATKVGYTA